MTSRIARLLQPVARIVEGDFARTDLPAHFDLAIGNPPFSDRTVRSDRALRSKGLRLHDYFIARSIDLLKPGALAAFVTSSGTMDKADPTAREHISKSADLIAAIRLPEGSFRQDAGTDVVVDILFFRKRKPGEPNRGTAWLDLAEVVPASEDIEAIRVNRWFAEHPDNVLGRHATTSGPFGETYTCLSNEGDLEADLDTAILSLPEALYDGEPDAIDFDLELCPAGCEVARPEEPHVREGSFFFDTSKGLMQVIDGKPSPVLVREGRSGEGLSEKQINIVKKTDPDPRRRACCAESPGDRSAVARSSGEAPHRLVELRARLRSDQSYQGLDRRERRDRRTRETHRRPNLQPFLDDPDCWLVAPSRPTISTRIRRSPVRFSPNG